MDDNKITNISEKLNKKIDKKSSSYRSADLGHEQSYIPDDYPLSSQSNMHTKEQSDIKSNKNKKEPPPLEIV